LLIAVIVGYYRGFWRSAAGLFSLGLGLWTAVRYHQNLALYLEQQLSVSQRLSTWLMERFTDAYSGIPGIGTETTSFPGKYLSEVAKNFPFTEPLSGQISTNLSDMINSSGEVIAKKLMEPILQNLANTVLDVVSFLLILIGIRFIVGLVFMLLGWVLEKRALGWVNRLAGILFSFTTQGIIQVLIFGLLAPFWPIFTYIGDGKQTGLMLILSNAVNTSRLVPVLVNLYGLLAAWNN